jgi:succinyl-diaminopimelate desuccinylase
MTSHPKNRDAVSAYVNRDRLVETAIRLVGVPSVTGDAGAVSDRLDEMLRDEGFVVERIAAGHPGAPAVSVRFESGNPGRTLQFDGHLDTVHLPFVSPRVEDGLLKGSGASDMKGGIAAAIEAVRARRDSGALTAGSVLLTAHDLHEAPWGDSSQLDAMIRAGHVGDAVLIPEPLCDVLPVAGRGSATWKTVIRRNGPAVHEVMRPKEEPSVIAAAAELVGRLGRLEAELRTNPHPICGSASVFIGQIHSGEIFNQYPAEAWLEGTRRWLPGADAVAVRNDFLDRVDQLAKETGTSIETRWMLIRDAFALAVEDPLVTVFQRCYESSRGAPLPLGPKPFVDDGNSFGALGGVPAITHGPRAGGQHTVSEWVEIEDLVRVAGLYASIAVEYCGEEYEYGKMRGI